MTVSNDYRKETRERQMKLPRDDTEKKETKQKSKFLAEREIKAEVSAVVIVFI